MYVKRKTNKVDRAKRMLCVRSERAIAITLISADYVDKVHAHNLARKLDTAYLPVVFVWPYQLYLFPSLYT
jgi:hypothetical protein